MLAPHVQRLFKKFGYEVRRPTGGLSAREAEMVRRVKGYTATAPGRIVGLMDAMRYVVQNRIAGSIVECGVWRGGSMMVAAWTLLELGDSSREIYLFDTYEGMSEPTDRDVTGDGIPVKQVLERQDRNEAESLWCTVGLDIVKRNLAATNYPSDKLHFVKGKVEETVPGDAPDRIALLRLDTDWYESTKHELEHLYPRLVPNGVLILDDYGHWQGAREAVDEYIAGLSFKPLMSRMDSTGRMLIKPPGA